MGFPRLFSLFIFPLLLLSMLQSTTCAVKKSYVVYLGAHSHGQSISPNSIELVANSHYEFLGSFLGSTQKAKDAIFYSYASHINGFAATLEEEEAEEISKHSNVISVFPNGGRRLHTTRSWNFLGLEKDGVVRPSSIWAKARYGQDTIIGNLDTGVWPESQSFNDDGYGPIPSRWKGAAMTKKLIGAKYFYKGFAADGGLLDSSNATARDKDGHGSHTLSTAGGNFVSSVSVFGYGNGTAKGGSPKARVAAYKVCWPTKDDSQCYDADILAAFDAAIQDGVDVISLSLSGAPEYYLKNSIAIGSFHAVKQGIVAVSSAGNEGPTDGSVSNVAPWLITVGASTMDREFQADVKLGNGQILIGQSLSPDSLPLGMMYPLINAGDARMSNASFVNASLCEPGTLDSKKVKGKIIVCVRGDNSRVDKGEQALLAGAVGMILANDEQSDNELIADAHMLPATHITYRDSLIVLFAYINATESPTAYITRPSTLLGTKPAPIVASFSSKGPNTVTPEILKPDITAPGVSVIAAFTNATGPSDMAYDTRRVAYNSISGTSMSCPHVSGISGLLKTLYPSWSPAAIKSAIMTTAITRDNNKEPMLNSSFEKATPFSYGAGHVFPNRAADPGLVYDLTTHDYLNFLCAIGYSDNKVSRFSNSSYVCPKAVNLLDFNYPSITVPKFSGNVTITRTLKNVGTPATYNSYVHGPPGISVTIEPSNLTFSSINEEKTFRITLSSNGTSAAKDYVFGQLLWSDRRHHVRSQIVVKAAA